MWTMRRINEIMTIWAPYHDMIGRGDVCVCDYCLIWETTIFGGFLQPHSGANV